MTERLDFTGRVAIVTGGGRGIGRAHAVALAARGASVVVNDTGTSPSGQGHDEGIAGAVAQEITAAGGTAVAAGETISTPDGAESIVRLAIAHFGRLDILINNAGIVTRGGYPEADLDDLNRHLAVDPIGSFNMCRAAWPLMADRRYGRIVMTITAASFGGANEISYATAKMGAWGLARALAARGRDCGINVNTVAPFGFSRMTLEGSGLTDAEVQARQRIMAAEKVSASVLWLVHEQCACSGELFVIGGGRVARLALVETGALAEPEPSPEGVRDHWDALMVGCESGVVPSDRSYIGRFHQGVPGWREAMG